jgi:hypothetical protein
LLVVVAVLLWMLAIYSAYYVVHKPLNEANARALAGLLADLLA